MTLRLCLEPVGRMMWLLGDSNPHREGRALQSGRGVQPPADRLPSPPAGCGLAAGVHDE